MALVKRTLICLFIYLLFGCFVAPTTEKNACYIEHGQYEGTCEDNLIFLAIFPELISNPNGFTSFVMLLCLQEIEHEQKCKKASPYKPTISPE